MDCSTCGRWLAGPDGLGICAHDVNDWAFWQEKRFGAAATAPVEVARWTVERLRDWDAVGGCETWWRPREVDE